MLQFPFLCLLVNIQQFDLEIIGKFTREQRNTIEKRGSLKVLQELNELLLYFLILSTRFPKNGFIKELDWTDWHLKNAERRVNREDYGSRRIRRRSSRRT